MGEHTCKAAAFALPGLKSAERERGSDMLDRYGMSFLRGVGDGLECDAVKLPPATQRKVQRAEKQRKSLLRNPNHFFQNSTSLMYNSLLEFLKQLSYIRKFVIIKG